MGRASARSRRPTKLIAAVGIAVLAIASAIVFATFQRPAAQNGPGSATTEAVFPDVSASTLEWDSAADEIDTLSRDVTAREQTIDLLWDVQPAATPETPESTP